jgi:membrane protein YqaA with SNARE-associated domain
VDAFGWPELVALLTSIGFGVVSAIVPVVNAEAYVIASQMSAVAGPIPIAIGIAVGQTIGKLVLFFGVREGRELSFVKHRRELQKQRPVGPTRARLRAAVAKLLDLVGQKRWGLPIVLVAAIIGFPPLYAVALLAGATTMRPLWFGLTVFVGRLCRFLLVASGFQGVHDWFF